MTRNSLRFERVSVDAALGISRGEGFAIEALSPSVNIIHGPNGSGKSTLSRVMQKLLWPTAPEVEPALGRATAAARIAIVGGERTRAGTVDLEAGVANTTLDGIREPLPVGSAELHARYRLPVTELLVETNEPFAREMLCQAMGGCDLDATARALGFSSPPSSPRALRTLRQTAMAEANQARATQDALLQRRRELQSLREERDVVAGKLATLDDLSRGREVLAAQDELQRAETAWAGFGPTVRTLSGQEGDELERLEKALRDATQARERHAAERTDLEIKLQRLGVTEAELAADVDALESAAEALKQAEARHRQDAAEEQESRTELAQAEADLFDRRAAPQAATLDRAALEDADALFGRALSCRAEQEALEAEAAAIRVLPAPDDTLPSADLLRRGVEALANWLRAPAPPVPTPDPKPGFPLRTLGAACAVLVVAFLLGAVLVHWALAAGAVGAVAVFFAAFLLAGQRSSDVPPASPAPTDASLVHRQTFLSIRLPAPPDWTVEAVSEALERLLGQLERCKEQDATAPRRDAHWKRLAAFELSKVELKAACTSFEQRYGISGATADRTWAMFLVRKIEAWQKARSRHEGKLARANAALAALAEARQACHRHLAAAGLAPAKVEETTADLAARRLATLDTGLLRWCDLDERLRLHDARNAGLDKARGDALAESATFWRRLGFAEADAPELGRLLHQAREFAGADDALRMARRNLGEKTARLGGAEPLLDRGLPAIEADLAQGPALRDRESVLNREIAAIDAELESAARGHDLSEALEKVAAANTSLRRAEEANADVAIGHTLVGWLKEQARDTLAPRVLTRARGLAARLTHGGLDFQVDASAETPRFLAGAPGSPRRPVTELSSGERVQLLMAVRLAFIEENEDCALPLHLDEVLASSDDERTGHIIDTVIEIARSGRQIFYYTAQANEVAKWSASLARGGIDSKVIDLREVRGNAERAMRQFPPPPPPRPTLPAPDGDSHRAYGERLGVPGVDPWDDNLGRLHLWHVIEDPALLHRVLGQGIERLGQLDLLLEHTGYPGLGDAGDRVLATATAFRAACRAWRIGRGRPVTREVLELADCVSGVFLDRVAELAREVGHDARRLLQALEMGRLPRWQKRGTQDLRAGLAARGYLDETEPLDTQALRDEVLRSLAAAGALEQVPAATLDRVLASLPR